MIRYINSEGKETTKGILPFCHLKAICIATLNERKSTYEYLDIDIAHKLMEELQLAIKTVENVSN